MSHEHVCIEDRVTALESKVAELEKPKSELVIVSPCGKKKVTIWAGKDLAGIWAEGKGGQIACLHASDREGPVVGIHRLADGKPQVGFDAALCYDKESGGNVQLISVQGHVHKLTPSEAGPVAKN